MSQLNLKVLESLKSLLSLVRQYSHHVSESGTSRITVPHRMARKIEKIKYKRAAEHHYRRGPLIISCHRSEYNHYKGQTYSDFSPSNLASHGWKHRKSVGDFFTINGLRGNPAYEKIEGIHRFSDLALEKELVDGLAAMDIKTPTRIQALTIPAMMEGGNILCAAETGSGKTYAYLLPIVQRMHKYMKLEAVPRGKNTPLAIILLPSHELVDQTYKVAQQLSTFIPFKTAAITGGRGPLLTKKQHVDLLIGTPGAVRLMLKGDIEWYNPGYVQTLVLDEGDTLLDDSFNLVTKNLIKKIGVRTEVPDMEHQLLTGTQLAIVGATMPRSLKEIIGDIVPLDTVTKVTTSYLHRLMPHIPHKFCRVNLSQRPELLLKHIKATARRCVPTIVFCNKSSTASYVGYFLEENNIDHVVLHGNMKPERRQGQFDSFQNGDVDIIVCTDIASRGLDTIRAQHVINYEFPQFMSDYIHRVGRVGRVGSSGTGYILSFICYKWDVDLLWQIEVAARRIQELHNVNANIKRKLTGIVDKKFGGVDSHFEE